MPKCPFFKPAAFLFIAYWCNYSEAVLKNNEDAASVQSGCNAQAAETDTCKSNVSRERRPVFSRLVHV